MTNVIIIGEGSPREEKILLKDNLGPKGWEKDAEIIAYANHIRDLGELSEAELFSQVVKDKTYHKVASLSLEGVDFEKFTMMDIFKAFMESLAYRMNQFDTEEFQEAEKK